MKTRVTTTIEVIDELGRLVSSVSRTMEKDYGGNPRFLPVAVDRTLEAAGSTAKAMLLGAGVDTRTEVGGALRLEGESS